VKMCAYRPQDLTMSRGEAADAFTLRINPDFPSNGDDQPVPAATTGSVPPRWLQSALPDVFDTSIVDAMNGRLRDDPRRGIRPWKPTR
jgi:hypothetical protein